MAVLVFTGSDAGFDFGDGAIDRLDGAGAMAAFVVLGPFEGGFRFTQMRKRRSHVRLVCPNRLKTDRTDQCHQNQTRF